MSSVLRSFSKKKGILAPFIDNWFLAGEFPESIPFEINMNKEKDDAFHPSSDPLSCVTLLYGRTRKEIPGQKFSAAQNKTFCVGHMYHGLLQWVLVEGLGFSGWEHIEHEVRRTVDGEELPLTGPGEWQDEPALVAAKERGTWWMRGSADVSSCVIPDQGDYLVDVKTARSYSFGQVGVDDKYWAKYEAQAQMYMDWHQKDAAIVLYQNKDGPHDFKERIIKRDPSFAEAVYERWAVVAEALANGVPPKCDCGDRSSCPGHSKYAAA